MTGNAAGPEVALLKLENRRRLNRWLGIAHWTLGVAVLVVGASLRADEVMLAKAPYLAEPVRWMQGSAWAFLLVLPPLAVIIEGARRRFGSPWEWETIQQILDQYQQAVFADCQDDPLDHHRVTLFRHRKWRVHFAWPRRWAGWLVPVARSGRLTRERISSFRAPDDPAKCEGVAGKAFRQDSWMFVEADASCFLRADKKLNNKALQKQLKTYAGLTGVSEDWVRRYVQSGRPLASSFAALTILHKGEAWGVLVIDSQSKNRIDTRHVEEFTTYGRLLTPLLGRI